MPYLKPLDSRTLLNRIKASAKNRGIPFDLELSEINNLSFPITCPILGIPLKYHMGKAQDDSYSFDRIDPNYGYTIDNIIIISHKANRLKNSLTPELIEKFNQIYAENKIK